MEGFLGVVEAAKYLGVSRDKLSRMIKAGEIVTANDPLDKRYRWIAVKDLDAILAKRPVAGPKTDRQGTAA
jgi:hypothetical protein